MDRRDGFDARLEAALRDLGPALALPAEPDLARNVTVLIRAQAAARPDASRRTWRVLAFATAVVLLVVSAALVFSPAAREAVADFLGIGGVRVKVGPSGPTPTAAPGQSLSLGEETTLSKARDAVDFSVLVPTVKGLGASPDRVYLSGFPPGGRVSLVYRPRPEWLPEARPTGVGLLISQFEGRVDPTLLKKSVTQQQVVPTDVNGSPALWVRGPHTLFFVDAEGERQADTLRLSANALIWTADGTTFRLESELGLVDALTIAESMR